MSCNKYRNRSKSQSEHSLLIQNKNKSWIYPTKNKIKNENAK